VAAVRGIEKAPRRGDVNIGTEALIGLSRWQRGHDLLPKQRACAWSIVEDSDGVTPQPIDHLSVAPVEMKGKTTWDSAGPRLYEQGHVRR
jgi:hypothetical protein